MAGRREFDRAKFKELVLYFSQASLEARDEGFGMVKLNKLLYRADFEAFRVLGHSITGATYEKQEYGPVARELPLALDELAAAGYIVWQHYEMGPYVRNVPAAREPADTSQFAPAEQTVMDRALEELAAHGAKSVSEWSHEESAGWRTADLGQEITYPTGIVNTIRASPEVEEFLATQLDEVA